MDKQPAINNIFNQFLSGNIPLSDIQLLNSAINEEDIDWLMKEIESLKDPSENFTGKIEGDQHASSGFFLFIDLVSALLISMGKKAELKLKPYENSSSMYIPWVIKYVMDNRFHSELQKKFGL